MEKKKKSSFLVTIFCLLITLWSSIVCAVEYVESSSASSLIICAFALATAFYLRGITLIILYIIGLYTFIYSKSLLLGTPVGLIEDHTSLISLMIYSWTISRMFLKTSHTNYLYQVKLKKSNENLKMEVKVRKKAQEELHQSKKNLEERVRERTNELLKANRKLQKEIEQHKTTEEKLNRAQKMEIIGTIASGVAHDLNNVLSGVTTYPEFMLLTMEKDHPLRKNLEQIRESGQKAANIVRDLLTLTRRGLNTKEVVDIQKVICDYLTSPEHSRLNLNNPLVTIRIHIEENLMNILGSPIHLHNSIMNLVSNATEAIEDQGEITIKGENCYLINHTILKEGEYVIISISDTGKGIKEQEIEKIFDPFYTKKKMGRRSGTGLGMAIVWSTIKDHKGHIEIESTLGKGTTFTLYFPATRKQVPQTNTQFNIYKYKGNGEKILVVDDIKEQREIASEILTNLEYSVVKMESGEKAIEYLKNNQSDLVLLDMIMDPGIDGLETYKEILKIHPYQKAIIASGFAETDKIKEVLRLGAGDFLRKPYLIKSLGIAIKKELYGEFIPS